MSDIFTLSYPWIIMKMESTTNLVILDYVG